MRPVPVRTSAMSGDEIAARIDGARAEVLAAQAERDAAQAAYIATFGGLSVDHTDPVWAAAEVTLGAVVDPASSDIARRLEQAEARAHAAFVAVLALGEQQESWFILNAVVPSLSTRSPEPISVLGPSTLSAEQLTEWYAAKYRITSTPIGTVAELAHRYISVGEELGVRGDIAFVQASHETGQFSSGHARRFNLAGIGAFDSCSPGCGLRFASLDDGVHAHLALLHDYATTERKLSPLSSPRDTHGCCPTWVAVSKRWATNPVYAEAILGEYRQVLEHAISTHMMPGL